MNQLNERIRNIPVPDRMCRLPISPKGFPVPWFVAKIDGKYDFRAIEPGKVTKAVKLNLCWLCGQTLGTRLTFVIGPMCAINRISSEPPCHRECAEYAVKACPFLTQPRMRRNEKDMPEGDIQGEAVMRNPGVTLIWVTRAYKTFKPDPQKAGFLFRLAPPQDLAFYREGRIATREEILESINSGFPLLHEMAVKEGAFAEEQLNKQYKEALMLLPT